MADEFTVSGTLKIVNGFFEDSKKVTSLSIDQTGKGAAGGVQNIGTSAEAIDMGDVGTEGMFWFRNVEAVDGNFVQIGQDVSAGGFEEFLKLNPGEFALGRLDLATGGVLQAKADSGAVELQYMIYEA